MIGDSDIPSGSSGADRRESKQPASGNDSGQPSGSSEAERRVADRYAFVHFVWFKIIEDDSESTAVSLEGISKMCDISQTGVGFYVTNPLPVGKTAFLEIVTGNFSLSATGEIVYARKEDERYYRVGVRFSIIPPNDRLLLNEYFGAQEEE